MPQTTRYSLRQRLYFGVVIAAGCALAAKSAVEIFLAQLPSEWLVLGALTLLTGSFTIRIPRLSIRISVSDAFVFASVLLFGGSVATVIVAVDSVVATFWMRPENRSIFRSAFNLSVASLSIWTAAEIFFGIVGSLPAPGKLVLTELLWPLFLLAAVYFLLNTWLIAIALSIEKSTNAVALWWKHFLWLSLNYFGGVSAAALLVSYTRAVDLGAVSIILPLLVISYLTYRTSLGRVQDAQKHLDQMNELYMSTIEALAMAVDAKDQITHGHIRRVQVYAVELAKRLGVSNEDQLTAIETAALLHDMGKLAIPEHILNKPGKLTAAEFDKMKRHADIGADLLSSIKFPYPVVPIVRHHHENWNGTGYPTGIAGTDIPLGARILSVVDCFDALTSDRPYRPRLSDEDAFAILHERRATMYDPLVVDTFVRVHAEIAPNAIKAGQDARSMLSTTEVDAKNSLREEPLEQIRANAFESTLLTEFATALEMVTTEQDAFAITARYLRQLMPSSVIVLFRYDTTSDTLIAKETSGDDQALLRGFAIRMGERITGWSAANNRTSVNSDAHLDLGGMADTFEPRLQSAISTPLGDGDRLIAVLSVYASKSDAFSKAHGYIIEHVASLLIGHVSPRVPRHQSEHVIAFKAATR
jgi:putative nucleotidyltransferase with HDIG domain